VDNTTNISATVEQIWGAACQAMSTNNGYLKDDDVAYREEHQGKQTNRNLVFFYAHNTDKISEQSMKDGTEVRNYLKGMLFKMIAQDKIGEYFKTLVKLASDDSLKLNLRNVSYIASAPHSVINEQLKDAQRNKYRDCERSYVGVEGKRITLTFKVIKTHYSTEWERYFVTAITTDNKLVSYSTANKRLNVVDSLVTATAKVKRHLIDNFTKHETTQLSHVKTGIR
jgi:hypothetical protein